MPQSVRFKELRSRIRELREHMLPANFSPTGDYSERQLDRARGFRLLSHAEIEAYLEDVAKDVTTYAIQQWKQSRKPSSLLIAFVASYHSSWNVSNDAHNEKIIQLAKARVNMKDSVNDIVDKAQTQFIQMVKDNHGIKEKNFKALILPTGIDIDEIDNTWLANLDNFGSLRGEIAHKSKRATSLINPLDELNTVSGLLTGLAVLDSRILAIRLT